METENVVELRYLADYDLHDVYVNGQLVSTGEFLYSREILCSVVEALGAHFIETSDE